MERRLAAILAAHMVGYSRLMAGDEVLRANPRFTLKAFASYVPFTDKRDLERNIQMLRKAGLPQ